MELARRTANKQKAKASGSDGDDSGVGSSSGIGCGGSGSGVSGGGISGRGSGISSVGSDSGSGRSGGIPSSSVKSDNGSSPGRGDGGACSSVKSVLHSSNRKLSTIFPLSPSPAPSYTSFCLSTPVSTHPLTSPYLYQYTPSYCRILSLHPVIFP